MKKSLIALAVAGVVAAPAAFAATSNVDIYGKMHVSVNFMNDQSAAIEDMQVSSNASRIGFKGSEDLGGGLKAIWQIESGVDIDEQSGGLASRNSFLGLSGGFGTALIGNHDTPLKLVGRKVDLFGDTYADSRNVMGGGNDTRAKNVVAYISPTFSGFHAAAAWTNDLGTSGTAGDANDNGAYSLAAFYDNGPLSLGLGYGDGEYHENNDLGAHLSVTAAYSFGDVKVVGQYVSLEDDTPAAGNGDYDAWMLGVAYGMGPITLKANYMTGEYDIAAAEPTQWTIGADYAMSKRTSAYIQYTDGEAVTLGAGGGNSDRIGPAVAGGDVSAVSVGIVHNF